MAAPRAASEQSLGSQEAGIRSASAQSVGSVVAPSSASSSSLSLADFLPLPACVRDWSIWAPRRLHLASAAFTATLASASGAAWLLGAVDSNTAFPLGFLCAASLGTTFMCGASKEPCAAWCRCAAGGVVLGVTCLVTAAPFLIGGLRACGSADDLMLDGIQAGELERAVELDVVCKGVYISMLWGTAGIALHSLAARQAASVYSARCVRCTLLLWLDIASDACLDFSKCRAGAGEPAAPAVMRLVLGMNFGLGAVTLVVIWTLLLQRLRALEASLQTQLASAGICRLIYCGVAAASVYQVGAALQAWRFCAVIFGVLTLLLGAAGFLVGRGFRAPAPALRAEMQETHGTAYLEARWALRALHMEIWAVVLTTLSTAANLLYRAHLYWTWQDHDHKEFDDTLGGAISSFDGFSNALCLALLCGTIVRRRSATLQRRSLLKPFETRRRPTLHPRTRGSGCWADFEDSDFDAWDEKVEELAGRGFRLDALLDFYASLLGPASPMPHFDPRLSTTNDVVREAIIPSSRHQDGSGGVALSTKWNEGAPLRADRMVTHAWSNVFTHLVAAIVADALGKNVYDEIAAELAEGRVEELKVMLLEVGTLKAVYWVCAFCINQHSCICAGLGREPEDPAQHDKWQKLCRDSVTGQTYPTCACAQTKYFNDEPIECELNKFDDVISQLSSSQENFSQVIAMDVDFHLLGRAWCVAEIVEAKSHEIPQSLVVHSAQSLDEQYPIIKQLDIGSCEASRPEDKAEIMSRIPDIDCFNEFVRALILEEGGLLSQWTDAESRLQSVGRVAARVMRASGSTASLP